MIGIIRVRSVRELPLRRAAIRWVFLQTALPNFPTKRTFGAEDERTAVCPLLLVLRSCRSGSRPVATLVLLVGGCPVRPKPNFLCRAHERAGSALARVIARQIDRGRLSRLRLGSLNVERKGGSSLAERLSGMTAIMRRSDVRERSANVVFRPKRRHTATNWPCLKAAICSSSKANLRICLLWRRSTMLVFS